MTRKVKRCTSSCLMVRSTLCCILRQQLAYAHEFIHALQDQHFDLDAFVEANSNEDDPDGWLALSALVEGDAMNATMQFLYLLHEDDDENPGGAAQRCRIATGAAE